MPSADKSIGRVYLEAAVDLSQLNKGFDQMVKAITDVDGKVKAYGDKLKASFEAAYNPTQKLGAQLEALAKQGKTAGELIAVFGDRIQKTMETVARTGAAPNAMVKNLSDQMAIMAKKAEEATASTGTGFARLGQAMTDFARNPLAATQAGITSILEKMGPLAVGIGGVAAAIGVAAYEFGKFVVSISDEVESLENLSAQTGISTQRLQALQQMQREAGMEGMDLSRIIAQLNAQMGKGEGEFLKTIKAMGIAVEDSGGQMRDAFDVLSDFGVALKGIQNPSEQAMVAMAALGPRAREFVAMLLRMQGSLKDVADQMQREGIGYTEEAKRQFGQIDSDLDRINRKWQIWLTALKQSAGYLVTHVGPLQGLFVEEATKTQPQMGPPLPPGYFQDRIKAQEDLDKKQKQSASEAIAAQKKINDAITASMEWQVKLNDETKVYGTLTDAAARIWQTQIRQGLDGAINDTNELYAATQKWVDSYEAIYQLKPIPLFEEAPTGQTFEDFKNSLPAINKEIDTFVAKNERSAQSVAEIWRNQVSTIVTDWSRGIADILIEGGDFGKKLTDIFKETAKSILRVLVESLFNPLKNFLAGLFGKLTGGLTGSSGTVMAGGLGLTGLLAGFAPTAMVGAGIAGVASNNPWAKAAGATGLGLAGGAAAITAGLIPGVGAASFTSALTGLFTTGGVFMAALPIIAPIIAAAIGIPYLIKAIQGKTADVAGAMEMIRDLGGVSIGKSQFAQFYGGVGLSESQAYGIRKDLLTSPLFISSVAVPAAQSQGRLDALLKSLEKVTVDTRIAASGYLNFRAAVEQGIKTGNWEAFNKQWNEAFQKSQALTAIMPDFASKLDAVSSAASEAADAATGLSSGMQALLDAIMSTRDAADDMYGTFLRTGEILPQLADEIQKYGGNLEVFQRYASLGGLRENLAAIGNLISGLNELVPDLDPIQKLLSGGGVDWGGLQAMGLDPSKLIGMADLVTFETRWEESVRQFQDTGKLLAGSVLQQALWKFGGAQGMTALQNYGQGFNTITPALLDMTKSAMDVAYKTERATAMDYLKGVQTSMESEIEAATDAIVTELRNILAAIQGGDANATPQSVTEQGGVYVDMRGATVYGYDDFRARVNQAVKSEYYRGGMVYAIP